MIAILVPCLGQSTEVFIDRHLCGLTELEPIVFTLGVAEQRIDVPTEVISPHQGLTARILLRLLSDASSLWNERLMRRAYVWEAKSFGAGRRLAKYLKRPDVDLVLVHFANMGTSYISQLKEVKVPLVIICHGSEIHSTNGHGPYLKRLRLLFEKSTKVLCVSKYIMDKVIEYGCPPTKAEVFYLGADIPDICPRRHGRGIHLRYIMTGRLTQIKGHEVLIRAFAQVYRIIENAELVLLGDGPLCDELKSLTHTLGIADVVSFLGVQNNSRVYDELNKADIYVHTSYNEGLGIAIVEAMAAYLPVVATRVGGIPEIVEHTDSGFLVPPGDVSKLAEAMVTLANDPLLCTKMGAVGRQIVEDRFDVCKQNARCVELLRKLINESASD